MASPVNQKSLEKRIDALSHAMHGVTAVVVIGLAIEYNKPLLEFFKIWDWKVLPFGGLLVTIGVAGELLIGYWSSRKENQLRTLEAAEFARLHQQAAEANKEAGIARKDAGEANERAKKYEADIAQAHARAAEAEKGTAEARLELAKLKEPRTLLPEQQDRIISVMKSFTGQRFALAVFPEPESLALARILDVILKAAGWQRIDSQIGAMVVEVADVPAGFSYASGLQGFVAPDDTHGLPALQVLAAILTEQGIPCTPHTTVELTGKAPKGITISVGKKP